MAATVEESTPPDMATAMVPVIEHSAFSTSKKLKPRRGGSDRE